MLLPNRFCRGESHIFWQGLFRLGHLAWAPHLLFPTAKVCSVKTVRFGWNFPLQGSRAGLGFSQRARHPVHQNSRIWYLGMFVRTLSDVCSGSCEGHRTCNRHHIDSNSVSFVTVSRVFQEGYIPLPGVNLALVGCNAGSCTLVGLFTWAQRAGELCLVLGRRMRLASFLGGLRAKWFDLCRFPLSTCTDDTRPPSN